MKILITEEEKSSILNMHINKGYKTLNENKIDVLGILKEEYSKSKITAVQNALLKNKIDVGPLGADGVFGSKTKFAIKTFQKKNGLRPDGLVGPCTAQSLGVDPLVGSGPCKKPGVKTPVTPDKTTKTDSINKVNEPIGYDCIAVDAKTCAKISSTRPTPLGSGPDKQCTVYARKCLSQYGLDAMGGSAWVALKFLKNKGGQLKYNMFDGGYNFNQLEQEIKKLDSPLTDCNCHIGTNIELEGNENVNVDSKCDKGKMAKLISDAYPNASSFDVSKLELGDIVGLYWKNSSNKGKAFCSQTGIDQQGNLKNKNVAINTHVGFIGAIKNGVPIIFHNVHGEHTAVPAKDFMSKSSPGMIVWVVSDPDVSKKINPNKKSPEKERTIIDKGKKFFSDLFDF